MTIKFKKIALVSVLVMSVCPALIAQQVLTLDDCLRMSVTGSKELEEARQKVLMSDYDRKIALANYFPKISASGTYMYNSRNLALISDETGTMLDNIGTLTQGAVASSVGAFMEATKALPKDAMWQAALQAMSGIDVSGALNAIGSSINQALHLDIQNVYGGIVSVQQPVFMGGKIVASNKIAGMAKELTETQYESLCQDVMSQVEQTYWQTVSIAGKKKLAQTYEELLRQMEADAEVSVAEGVAVQSDLLGIKVKHNEARTLVSRTSNGLVLSKMLLCKQIGLPLDSDITLSDENLDFIPEPEYVNGKSLAEIEADRMETRMLSLAGKIYDKKVNVAVAEMLPKIAVTGNYLITNPNLFNGYQNNFGGMFNVGVCVNIPIFHATENLQRTRKAKAEAQIYKIRYEDACQKIDLQVQQLMRQQDESRTRLIAAASNLDCAEENLRSAMLGFSEGVVETSVTLQAQTAWMQAHSEYIEAGVEAQMTHSNLLKAQGIYRNE